MTITVTLADGVTTVVSPASAQAAARTVADPPALPAAQVGGCACNDVLAPTEGGQVTRGEGVDTATGSFSTSAEDLRLAGFGVPFDAVRTYASDNTTAGVMGIGWSFSYDIKVIPPASGQTPVTVRAEDGAQAVYTAGTGSAYNTPPGVRSTLSAVTGGGWKLVTPSQTAYSFDATGRLISVLDSRGNGLHLTYTASSMTITDAAGRAVVGALNSAGLLTSLALPDRRSVAFGYTGGLLTSAKDAGGNTWTFGYTGQLLTTIVDPTGVTQLTNTYSGNRVVKQVDAASAATTFAWDATKQQATTTDADGVSFYDGYRGNSVVYTQNSNGDTTNQRYDAAVNPNLAVDAQNNQTVRGFDGAHNPTSATAPDPFGFQVSSTFDANNNLLSHTDGQGNTTKYGYTAYNELSSITPATGENTTLAYNAQGLVSTATDARGKVTTFAYDASGNLLSETTPMGEKTSFTYDGSGRVQTVVDPRENVSGATAANYTTQFGYDNLDRVTWTLQPGKQHASTTTYNTRGEVTLTQDAAQHSTNYGYGPVLGRTTSITDPDSHVTSYGYTTAGRKASVTDPMGDQTTYTYDSRGNLSTVVAPLGNVAGGNKTAYTTTYTYDSNGNLLETTRPNPAGGTPIKVDARFDQLNRADNSIDPLGNSTVTGYDNNSAVTSVTDPGGNKSTWGYDIDGRLQTTATPAGGKTVTAYDAAGNVSQVTSAIGGVTTYTYNADEKLATSVDPRGNVAGANPATYTTSYGYDPAGNLTSVTDPLGDKVSEVFDGINRVSTATDANNHTVTYQYLDDDSLQQVTGPDGNTKAGTSYGYDFAGNMTTRTDASGTTNYAYDKANRVTDVTDALKRDTQTTYDADSQVTSTVLPGSTAAATRTIAYTYDTVGRRIGENEGGTLSYSWGYDANSRVTALTDPTGTRSQGYDNLGRLTSVSRGGQSFGYTYDSDGNLSTRTWPDGTTVAATYNPADQPSTLTVSGGQAGTTAAAYGFNYDPAGRLSSTTYPTANHLTTDRAYDAAGRLSDLNSHDDAGTVARYQLTRDAKGNPTDVTTTRGTTSQNVAYTYDVFDRLTAACVGTDCGSTATGKTAYTYDEVGNRLTQTLSGSAGNSSTTYNYDVANQLNSSTTTTPAGNTQTQYAYDGAGNQTQAGTDTFAYNLDHTLASATVGGNTTAYTYDAQHLELSAGTNAGTGSAKTRTWQTDVNTAVPTPSIETDTSGGTSTSQDFLQGPGGTPLALLTGGQADSYAPDTVGSVASILTPSGTDAGEYDYDAFGNPRTDGTAHVAPTVTNPIGYAGDYQDSTLGNRYATPNRTYDPGTGRFNATDPVGQSQRSPSSSPYAYVGDQPTVRTDPSGLTAIDALCDGAAGCTKTTLGVDPSSTPALPVDPCAGLIGDKQWICEGHPPVTYVSSPPPSLPSGWTMPPPDGDFEHHLWDDNTIRWPQESFPTPGAGERAMQFGEMALGSALVGLMAVPAFEAYGACQGAVILAPMCNRALASAAVAIVDSALGNPTSSAPDTPNGTGSANGGSTEGTDDPLVNLLKGVNPDGPAALNCGYCAIATNARLQGTDITAKQVGALHPGYDRGMPPGVMEALFGGSFLGIRSGGMSLDNISYEMEENGPGSTGIMYGGTTTKHTTSMSTTTKGMLCSWMVRVAAMRTSNGTTTR